MWVTLGVDVGKHSIDGAGGNMKCKWVHGWEFCTDSRSNAVVIVLRVFADFFSRFRWCHGFPGANDTHALWISSFDGCVDDLLTVAIIRGGDPLKMTNPKTLLLSQNPPRGGIVTTHALFILL